MQVTQDIRYIGVNDHTLDLFEGQYAVPNGMAYNSYAVIDERIAVLDTVDIGFTEQWLANLAQATGGRRPDYLIVQHMEPDHSASLARFAEVYPDAVIVGNQKTFAMISAFFGTDFADRRMVVGNGDSLSLGRHTLSFVFAPMVHWPEVMVTYDQTDRVLFSADAFGKFGALDCEEPWEDEARRYYIGIVGKYGAQVQSLLRAAEKLDIAAICPLHGPVLRENLAHYIGLYRTWSGYEAESRGIVICYTSVYGHTAAAVSELAELLRRGGRSDVVLHDLARTDPSRAVADAFRYPTLVLATTTYNADIFPFMREFIDHLTERNFRRRTVALIENGSWVPAAAKVMRERLASCKDLTFIEPTVHIRSALSEESRAQLEELAAALLSR